MHCFELENNYYKLRSNPETQIQFLRFGLTKLIFFLFTSLPEMQIFNDAQ